MTQMVYLNFTKPLAAAFGAPPGSDPDAFFDALASELRGFSQYQLEAGAKHIVRERSVRSFPTVAECICACTRFSTDKPAHSVKPSDMKVDEESSAARKHKAMALMRQDMAMSRKASKEGWLGQLYDYAMGSGYLPPLEAGPRLAKEAERVRSELKAVGGSLGLMLIDAYTNRYKNLQREVFDEKEMAA